MQNRIWLALSFVALTLALGACSSQLRSPAGLEQTAVVDGNGSAGAVAISGESVDLASEEAVSEGCLKSWRQAVKGEQSAAMKQLEELDRQYPRQTTVRFMMGQVMEHFGKKSDAVKFYREALSKQQQQNSLYLFKLAEALRTSGDTKAAIVEYRKILGCYPRFVPAKIGLSKVLLMSDRSSAEAKEQLEQAQRLEQDNQEVKSLLAGLASGK
jgi:tetratricopeptide (TPR) repeat protein